MATVEVAPYWNVNTAFECSIIDKINVEVAPYWNVNFLYKFS